MTANNYFHYFGIQNKKSPQLPNDASTHKLNQSLWLSTIRLFAVWNCFSLFFHIQYYLGNIFMYLVFNNLHRKSNYSGISHQNGFAFALYIKA